MAPLSILKFKGAVPLFAEIFMVPFEFPKQLTSVPITFVMMGAALLLTDATTEAVHPD